jgi:molybdate-binding protein/transcriptional regulator with XRE-family HTH domain
MANPAMLENDVRLIRTTLGLSQAELARRSGLSRAGISAIETGRLIPSTAAALALGSALGCAVESLFRLPGARAPHGPASWAWTPEVAGSCRYWRALIGDRSLLYPVEVSPLGLLPHDGLFQNGAFFDHPEVDPARTLVLASCDPAVGLLAAELAQTANIRLIVVPRSSRSGLELLARGLVHAAGVHLARADQEDGNGVAVLTYLAEATGQDFQLLRLADWEEGIALAPALGLTTIRAAVTSRLRWVAREPGSGARQCLDELPGKAARHDPSRPMLWARDHRGVADAIRSCWADAGVCLRLTSEEANLSFLGVRREAYDICFHDALAGDRRLRALLQAVRSARYRRSLGELPGYHTSQTGELTRVRIASSRTRRV